MGHSTNSIFEYYLGRIVCELGRSNVRLTFTFTHLADAFIQSDLHCIQVTVFTFDQLLLSLGIEPMILALLAPCSTIWATGKLNLCLFSNTYKHHHCVCHATLFLSLGLELMVKLTTLLTVFTLILKAEAGGYISDECLWCSANHNALCQLANQSTLCLSEGGTL